MRRADSPSGSIKEDIHNPTSDSLDSLPEREEVHGGGANDGNPQPDIKAGDTEKDGSKAPVQVREAVHEKLA